MTEIDITRSSRLIDPFHVWGWEIPVYLFLGGLAAGVMIFTALLGRREGNEPSPWATRLPFATPVLLSVGMLALFLDLEYKDHVFRFYGAFKPASPMSWGAWILLLVYPASIGLGLAGLDGRDREWLSESSAMARLTAWMRARRRGLEVANILLGISLGIYTGVLLGALGAARPLWNSALLGPIFLVSGASTGAALMMLFPLNHTEHDLLRRWDMGAIGVEAALLALFIIGLLTGGGLDGREAAALLLGGPYTAPFWSLVVLVGLVIPFAMKAVEVARRLHPTVLAPTLVLLGGLSLRWILVAAGQAG